MSSPQLPRRWQWPGKNKSYCLLAKADDVLTTRVLRRSGCNFTTSQRSPMTHIRAESEADEAQQPIASRRREQLATAVIGVEFSATLPLDRGTTRGGRGVGGRAEGAAQAIGAAASLAGGKGRAGGGDAEHQ